MVKEIKKEVDSEIQKKVCGIIMPIADSLDYPLGHWRDVYAILCEAIDQTEFEPKLVSEDLAVGLIHDRIVTNIYNNEIVVCDVSSKNPNVMFELGLRLAFDKPTIIIKDEITGYSFDTGVIEHINYPSSLRFGQIIKFKDELIKRINATYEKFNTETNYSPFLKSFGKKITPASIQSTEISEGKYILEQLDFIRKEMQSLLPKRVIQINSLPELYTPVKFDLSASRSCREMIKKLVDNMSKEGIVSDASVETLRDKLCGAGIEIGPGELAEFVFDYIAKRNSLS